MSYGGGVTPSEVLLDTTLEEVTPRPGKGPLSTWWVLAGLGSLAEVVELLKFGPSPAGKPLVVGVDMGQRLSFTTCGKAAGGKARVRTGLGKSDRPGS
jgi:hypothetical protein